jgi:hypothetical protein
LGLVIAAFGAFLEDGRYSGLLKYSDVVFWMNMCMIAVCLLNYNCLSDYVNKIPLVRSYPAIGLLALQFILNFPGN